jgi:Uncharacterized protein conserved in bacteria (DUF2188)
MVERIESGATTIENAVHVLVGRQHWLITRIQPPLSAHHTTLEDATRHAREIAARDRSTLLIHDARGDIVTRESYRDS